MRRLGLLLVIAIAGSSVFAAGCSQQSTSIGLEPEKGQNQPVVTETETPSPEPAVPTAEVIKIEVYDWGWNPEVITVSPGQEVVIEVSNTGRLPHGIWIPELGINEGVRSGKTMSVNLKAPSEPGELTIRCSDPECGSAEQHSGMVGTLDITG